MADSSAAAQSRHSLSAWLVGLAIAALIWVFLFSHLSDAADAVIALLRLSRDTHLGEAVHFFVLDTPHILLLLVAIVFVMGIVQTYFRQDGRAPCFMDDGWALAMFSRHRWVS